MMTYKDVEFDIIYSRRKTVAIQVNQEAKVTVRAPLRTSKKYLLSFVESRYDWIKGAIKKQENRAQLYNLSAEEIDSLKLSAKAFIPKRVEYYSNLMNLKPSAVKINLAKTRFGSCSGKNSLNFSAYLMLFPQEAIDYVVVHELAHIKHHNHSKEFYKLIEDFLPDYKIRADMLKIQ